jgi:ribosome maturation protein Sdo1
MIYYMSLNKVSTTNKNVRNQQAMSVSGITNVSAFETVSDPGTWKVTYDPKTENMGEVKFYDSRAKDLEAALPEILSKIMPKEPLQVIWIKITAQISSIIQDMSQKHDV